MTAEQYKAIIRAIMIPGSYYILIKYDLILALLHTLLLAYDVQMLRIEYVNEMDKGSLETLLCPICVLYYL